MNKKYIYSLKNRKLPKNTGNKARTLYFLIRQGYSVPLTYVCKYEAYMDSLQDEKEALNKLKIELSEIIDPGKVYAVRSSANLEDEVKQSYAGQFKTILNIKGLDKILEAIQEVWNSARSTNILTYGKDIKDADLSMGVIIQEMVYPEISGVSFSKPPIPDCSIWL